MTRSAPTQRSFSSGEVSPLLAARVDYQRHQSGLRACRGFLPLRQGGFTRAPGTLYDGRTLDDAEARLIAFTFSGDDAVVLEFTAYRMRVWRYGVLVTAGGAPYELVHPYGLEAVRRMRFVQTADVIYLTDGERPPQKLSRFALDNWTIEAMAPTGGPLRAFNSDEALTLQASGQTGSITLTASAALFLAGHVDALFALRVTDWATTPLWTGNATISLGDRMRYDGQVYEVTDVGGGDSGVNPPVHRSGVALTEKGGPKWRWVGTDTGLVRITAVASGTSATATVLQRIPSELTATATSLWAEGAWSDVRGWPAAVALFDQRLVFAATASEPRTVWFSTVGAYEDFSIGDPDQAIAYTIDAARGLNRILWLEPGDRGLHVGAEGEIHSSRSTQALEAITAENAQFQLDASVGSADAQPVAPDGRPIFIARDRARVFQLAYQFENDRIQAQELSLPADHLGADRFTRIVWQSSPLRMAWLTRESGEPVVMIHDPAEEVLGWAVIPMAGGAVEDVAVTPGVGGDDEITFVVRRTIGGETRRHVERLGRFFHLLGADDPILFAEHLHAAVIREPAAPAATFTGLDHLEGEDVLVWTGFGQFGPFTVAGGSVTLPKPVSRAFIGLDDPTHLAGTLDLYAAVRDGDPLGRPISVRRVGFRLHRTAAYRVRSRTGEFGRADIVGDWITRAGGTVPGDLVEGWSGVDVVQGLAAGHARAVALDIAPLGAAPLTMLAMTPEVEARS